jgi:hypothetical protein
MDEKTPPTSSNPNDYAAAVTVEDDEILLLKAQMDEKFRNLCRLRAELEMVQAEQTALKHRLFFRLGDLYPNVRSADPEGGVGIREWQNCLWYVAWNGRDR